MAPPVGSKLHPSYIKFTQDSIKSQFMDGKELSSTLEQLLYRRKTVDDIPPIEVVEDMEDCGYWALTGNRRLYLYRKLEELGVIETIPVIELNFWEYGVTERLRQRKTTDCDGLKIRLRGYQGELRMNQIIEGWRRTRPAIAPQIIEVSVHEIPTVHSDIIPKKESVVSHDMPKKESVVSRKEVPMEQPPFNRGTAESDEGVTYTTDEDHLLKQSAILYQPLRERNYTKIHYKDDDDCCSCCSWYIDIFVYLLIEEHSDNNADYANN